MGSKTPEGRLAKALRLLHRGEDLLLVSLLLLMILLATGQILFRNFWGGGVVWGDTLVRILVLWIGLMGAMVATRQKRHISMDVLTRYLPKRLRCLAAAAVELFSAAICAAVCYYSIRFVREEVTYGGTAFAGVPAWVCEAIIPLAFSVIALRYLLLAVESFNKSRELRP